MPNYTRMAATTKRLIDGSGRVVTFRASAGTLKDVNQPWLGKTAPVDLGTPRAVFLDFDDRQIDGELVRIGDKRALVAADTLGFTPETGMEVIDDGLVWEVIRSKELRPADDAILYDVHLRA